MRRFARARVPKKYAWVTNQVVASFDSSNVVQDTLVDGSEFTHSTGLSRQDHVLNIQRIVGDVVFTVSAQVDFNPVTDTFIYGPVAWGLIIIDSDDLTTYDPETSSITDETMLGLGMTDHIGLLVDTGSFVGGTGLSTTWGHQVGLSTRLHLDIHTNRRLTSDQSLQFICTRPSSSAIALNGGIEYAMQSQLRVLVKFP